MKKYAALLMITLGLFASGSAFAVGAIAVDDSVGEKDPAWGVSTGEDTEAAAKKAALKLCKENGDNCGRAGSDLQLCASSNVLRLRYGAKLPPRRWKCGNKNCKVVVAECEDD
jgi:hypothetical protein